MPVCISNKVNFQNYFTNKLIKMVRFFEVVQKPRSTCARSLQHVYPACSTCACSTQYVCIQLAVRVHAASSTCI